MCTDNFIGNKDVGMGGHVSDKKVCLCFIGRLKCTGIIGIWTNRFVDVLSGVAPHAMCI